MTVYADYTPDEQRLLTQAIEAAAIVVSTASPGPKADTVSEGFAAASYVLDSLDAYVGNTLVTSIIVAIRDRLATPEAYPDYVQVATSPDAAPRARGILESVADLVDARAPADEATGYKRWLVHVADVTANGAVEDRGFLGFGGVQVNDAERAAIADVSRLLGLSA
jgi:hypothetical protein